MRYYSTNTPTEMVDVNTAVMRGMAADGGLFMPQTIPVLSPAFIAELSHLPFKEIAHTIAQKFFGDDIPSAELAGMVDRAFTFPVPVVSLCSCHPELAMPAEASCEGWVSGSIFVLELFHGPTLAFKDFAARFMAQLMSYFTRGANRETVVLVATSGDTGSAVADGFLNAPGIRVIILYPRGKVSALQEQHLTTRGGNVTAVAIEGTFDDCQRLVKQALADTDVQKQITLASANSINIARLLPQSFYYCAAYGAVAEQGRPVVFSVPSGNFGNLTAGLLAKRMGLPVHRFIAATNSNDVVPQYLRTGVFSSRASQQTLSNAMDVGNPSNFARMRALYADHIIMGRDIVGLSYSDQETRRAMQELYAQHGYISEPHTAIAYAGLADFQRREPGTTGIFVATAHPAKFNTIVEETLGISLPLPAALQECMQREKHITHCAADYAIFKDMIFEK